MSFLYLCYHVIAKCQFTIFVTDSLCYFLHRLFVIRNLLLDTVNSVSDFVVFIEILLFSKWVLLIRYVNVNNFTWKSLFLWIIHSNWRRHVACRNAPPPPIGVIHHEEVYQLFIMTRQASDKLINCAASKTCRLFALGNYISRAQAQYVELRKCYSPCATYSVEKFRTGGSFRVRTALILYTCRIYSSKNVRRLQ